MNQCCYSNFNPASNRMQPGTQAPCSDASNQRQRSWITTIVKGWSKYQQCAPLSLHLHRPRLPSSQLPPSYPEEYHKRPGIYLFQLCPQPSCLPRLPSPFSLGWQLQRSDSAYITKAQAESPTNTAGKQEGRDGVKGPWGKRGVCPSFHWAHPTHGDNLFLQPGSPACQERIQSVGYKPIATM